jgi:hypothetical protein
MDRAELQTKITEAIIAMYHSGWTGNETAEECAEQIMELFDSIQPKAGTSAYQMVAAAAMAEVETTETLMQMLAATILATLIEEEGTGRSNITYSPASMDHMMKNYTFTTEKDAMATTIRIEMKPDSDLRDEANWRAPSNRHQVEDVSDAKPQAEPKTYDRPLWAIRADDTLYRTADQADAERQLKGSFFDNPLAIIVNRHCLHLECPDSVCNQPEQK